MTKEQTITHKPWCREHQTDYEGEHCHVGFEFGPMKPGGVVWWRRRWLGRRG